MSLKNVARETIEICETGRYTAPSGRIVDIGPAQRAAEAGTRLYTPDELEDMLFASPSGRDGPPPTCRVSPDTTQVAAQRMAADGPVVALNFASARNPGGGFVRGAKAQEEDVARCSGLYPCLMRVPEYYAANRAERSVIYTDHIIYSPEVPFFRVRSRETIEEPFQASIITAPAPNAGEARRKGEGAKVSSALRKRAGMVLAVAEANGHRRLLLGAWGCGVFRNDPAEVADIFLAWLNTARFAGAFDLVEFAVWDRTKTRSVFAAFDAAFG